ncbi:MAG: hypothetical protein R3255_10315, partial [Candidatus Lokiarchaeia archaeon]|nr:hypothetical protein [Candidatus Lokiarchaeia archaeon]
MYKIVQEIIDECGPRMPGSPQEAKSAEFIKNELEKTCDEVHIEPFTFHPRAALGWIRIALVLVLSSFCLFFLIRMFLYSNWMFIFSVLAAFLAFLT